MKTDQPLFLNEEQVREHLRMTELIPAMEKALIDFSAGRVTQPVRQVIPVDPPGGFLWNDAGANARWTRIENCNLLSLECRQGIPTHMATIVLERPRNRNAARVMDGRLITEMRTAAVSAAATNCSLAPKNANVARDSRQRSAGAQPCGSAASR